MEEEVCIYNIFNDCILPVILGIVAGIIMIQIVQIATVDGVSMYPTLQDEQNLVVYKLYKDYERGDIIVVEDTENKTNSKNADEKDTNLVKRLIGLPGDHVEINIDGELKINGEVIDETNYAYYNNDVNLIKVEIDITLKEDEIFIIGDNRNNSLDSRIVGPFKTNQIQGKIIGKH